ncbi:unnamed protein product [Orchesella dallaii]|uniref:C2H2-type domain-containing protein n=1 Tax=Orchesella dallaii TaxID=48710 RepID=A0ABP1S1B9_9HEXA
MDPLHCLLCGDEIIIIKEEPDELETVNLDVTKPNKFEVFQCFYKLFRIKPSNQSFWKVEDDVSEEGDQSNQFPFCYQCSSQLRSVWELQRQLKEVELTLRSKLEEGEDRFEIGRVYQKDKRYYKIRREILGGKVSPVNEQREGSNRVTTRKSSKRIFKETPRNSKFKKNRVVTDGNVQSNQSDLLESLPPQYGDNWKWKQENTSSSPSPTPPENDNNDSQNDYFPPSTPSSSSPPSSLKDSVDVPNPATDLVPPPRMNLRTRKAVPQNPYLNDNDEISSDSDSTSPPPPRNRRGPKPKLKTKAEEAASISRRTCSICLKLFTTPRNMIQHKMTVHRSDPLPPGLTSPCPICGKPFFPQGSLKAHIWTHFNKEDKEEAISRGEKPPSKLIKNFQCELCPYSCETRLKFVQHQKTVHVSKEERQELCPLCGVSVVNVKKHIRNVHEAEKKHACSICGKKFKLPSALRIHRESVHVKEKQWKCEYCPREFAIEKQMKLHVKSHLGIRPFKCEICEVSFTISTLLKRHNKTFHEEGSRPGRKSYVRGPEKIKLEERKSFKTSNFEKE